MYSSFIFTCLSIYSLGIFICLSIYSLVFLDVLDSNGGKWTYGISPTIQDKGKRDDL